MTYPSNSHKVKHEQKDVMTAERRKIEKVVSGPVELKKKKGLGKVARIFISEDIHKVKSYLTNDILVPALKRAAMGTLDMILNGGKTSYTGTTAPTGQKISYRKYYDDQNNPPYMNAVPAKPRFDYDIIKFQHRGEAEAVLDEMRAILGEFKSVTVADMYDLVGLDHPYTFTKYGWMTLQDVRVVQWGDGYIIELPKATTVTY